MNHSTRARAYERVARLTAAQVDLATFLDEASALLAKALPHDAACWHTMDPATLIETGFFLEDMPNAPDAEVAALAYLPDDFNSFVALARSGHHSGVLSAATGGRPEQSVRYRELLRPNNVIGELRTSCVVDGACWGNFAFFREAPADFTEDEQAFAHDLASLLGGGFRGAVVRARSRSSAVGLWPGLLLFDENRQVESATGPASHWLGELGFRGTPIEDPLPYALLTVAEHARGGAGDASVRVRGESGVWVEVHASPVSGGAPGRIAVILQSATAPSVAPLLSAAYGLTARERELVDLVLQGCGTGEIATRLFISPHTVQGHLKSIFAKTGVRSRRELVTRVFVPDHSTSRSPRDDGEDR
ncbi:helix-turn-helix transcriptional regulator [Streptomyces sp. GESEQ-35]|uniref:helix-turn-helix transcriptional regulator n=1 Tax=Streptomyces sp. GESEQ-35 TaxID=2812657 RepID=UPI001B3416A9|nr:helix-turn-helix transcriptional regulator [Streptomyces sp. GESEQ-35]